jgi:hypothetical protein
MNLLSYRKTLHTVPRTYRTFILISNYLQQSFFSQNFWVHFNSFLLHRDIGPIFLIFSGYIVPGFYVKISSKNRF